MNADDQYDPDQAARDAAAVAAQQRAQRVAGELAAEHADNAYNAARDNVNRFVNNDGSNAANDGDDNSQASIARTADGSQAGQAGTLNVTEFQTAAVRAMNNVATTLATITDRLGSGKSHNSRSYDGQIVIEKDISSLFTTIPESLQERNEYLEKLVMRLENNQSGVRMKIELANISAYAVGDDPKVERNHVMRTFKNINVVVPFATVFSTAGAKTTVMISDEDGLDCLVQIPTRIWTALSKQVYCYLYDNVPRTMRMLHSDCPKHDGVTLISHIRTPTKQPLYTPFQVLQQRLDIRSPLQP